jgi:hypothetical protein
LAKGHRQFQAPFSVVRSLRLNTTINYATAYAAALIGTISSSVFCACLLAKDIRTVVALGHWDEKEIITNAISMRQ